MKNYTFTKYACYVSSVSMSAIVIISPLLFETFRGVYGISYTLLGFLAVINFVTQLIMDLIFTLFSSRFNVQKVVKLTPFLTFFGFLIYAVLPQIFPSSAYLWLALGTVLFSASGGFCEVLLSPIIAALPSDNPERDMSKLHATYAWGLVGVVIFSTLLLRLVGQRFWYVLPLAVCLLPLLATLLFFKAEFPHVNMGGKEKGQRSQLLSVGIILCFLCIFFGGAAESAMTQWVSSYLETAVSIPKVVGDILGVALFASALGMGRTLYAKYGKNITIVMLAMAVGAIFTYTVASISTNTVIALTACVLTGLCVSMLWPGTIIIVGEKFSTAGVAVYALMAAGGDLGTAVAPQIVGAIADKVALSEFAQRLSEKLSLSVEEIAMRTGLFSATLFAAGTTVALILIKLYFSKNKRNED